MLDVLIIVSETTPREYVSLCRRTVENAAMACPYQVNVIATPGVPGHIGKARLRSLERSTAPYVAWVDDDDFVKLNAFSCLGRHFAVSPTAVCAREIRLFKSGLEMQAGERHHLTAWRRDVVDSVPLDTLWCYDLPHLFRAAGEGAIDELSWVYMRRIWDSPMSAVRREYHRKVVSL